MDHPIENYDAVFFHISSLVDPEVRLALGLVSHSSATLAPRRQADPFFWKSRWEELMGRELPVGQQPGKTSWRWKCETLEREGPAGIMKSEELQDIKEGYRLLVERGEPLSGFAKRMIVNHALMIGDEAIIRYLRSILMKDFQSLAGQALGLGITRRAIGEEPALPNGMVRSDIPIGTAKILLDPSFGLNNVRFYVNNAMRHQGLPVVALLLDDPRARLDVYGESYLDRAWENNRKDVFFHLLDLKDVRVSYGFIRRMVAKYGEEEMKDVLKHPRVAAVYH